MSQLSPTQQASREKLVYLRQWVGNKVNVHLANGREHHGVLTNIVFDGTRLMYIVVDDLTCFNFDHVIEVRLAAK